MGDSNGPEESTSQSTPVDNNIDAGDFECNICFDLAQDPIITLCGHLFCWPCLYRWLSHHSISHECPVCKAIIEEEKLVPLYGRGKMRADPRGKSYPGIQSPPRRPAIQRPETATPAFPSYPTATRGGNGIGNVTFSAVLGTGLSFFPSLFNFQFQNYSDATVYGSTSGYPYGFHAFHGGYAHRFPMNSTRGQQGDAFLRNLLIVFGFLVLLFLLLCW